MKTALSLATVIVLSIPACGQIVINEIYTDVQDAIELLNNGAAPASLAGHRIEYGGLNPNLVWTPGTFNFPSSANMAPGELVVVREATTGPPVLAGTTIFTTSININWATTGGGQTRGGACILVDGSNQGIDMIRWLGAQAPNEFGASFSGTYNPNSTSFSRIDFTDNNNASDWGDEPLALGSLSNGQTSSINVLSVALSTTGVGDLNWSVTTSNPAAPGAEIYNLVSTQDFVPDGSGPLFGVGFDAVLLLAQPASATNPFHTFLDAQGQWSLTLPPGVVPAGFHAEVVSILLGPSGVDRVSSVDSVTF